MDYLCISMMDGGLSYTVPFSFSKANGDDKFSIEDDLL